jgi:hypothetical protein
MFKHNPYESTVLPELIAASTAATKEWDSKFDEFCTAFSIDIANAFSPRDARKSAIARFEASKTGGQIAEAYRDAERRLHNAERFNEGITLGKRYLMADLNVAGRDAVYRAAAEHGIDVERWPEEVKAELIATLRANPAKVDDRAAWIAERFGAEAAAIVVALADDLGMQKLERVLELAQAGDSAFRKAVERHITALRKQRAADLAERKRQQEMTDQQHHRRSIAEHIAGTAQVLAGLRAKRESVRVYTRAEGRTIAPESAAAEDAEIAKYEAQLERLQGELAQLDAPVAA